MSFGLDTRNIKGITSHAEAKAYFEATKPWRDRDPSTRPLDKNRRKHHCAIEKIDNDYACTLYDTRMVMFHADDTVTIHFHPSKSSMAFLWAVLRIPIMNAYPHGYAIELSGKIYQLAHADIIVQKDPATGAWEPIDLHQTEPWTELFIDRRKVRAIENAIGYERFACWYKAVRHTQTGTPVIKGRDTDYLAIVAQEPSDWVERDMHRCAHTLQIVRDRIRNKALSGGREHKYLTSWRDVTRLRRQAVRLQHIQHS